MTKWSKPKFKWAAKARQTFENHPHLKACFNGLHFVNECAKITGRGLPDLDVLAAQALNFEVAKKEYSVLYLASSELLDFLEKSRPTEDDLKSFSPPELNLMIHLPNRKNSLFLCTYEHSSPKPVWASYGGSRVFAFEGFLQDPTLSGKALQYQNTFFLICNLSLYLQAFPECLKPGAPKGFERDDTRGRRYTLETAKPIRESYAERHVSPHWRRGHLRTLRAERYGDNRGKVIYVKPTTVKGRVETLTEPE